VSKLKVLELFGGIGACSKALERLGIDYEIADYVEIDKYAVKSFNAMHNTNFEPQDICEWDKDIEVDLLMHGSPCQDISVAGSQKGADKDSGTRSSLMYETIRIVSKLKPKYVIWENVKNLLSKKHIHNFNAYLETLEQLGYKNYYQVLNAKDYGIPQNRERVFTVSILGDENYDFPNKQDEANLQDFLEKDTNIKTKPMCEKAFNREYEQIITSDKDIYQCNVSSGYQDCKVGIKVSPTIRAGNNCTHILQRFEFPPKKELKLKLKDMLEDEVDEKYYLSDKMVKYISATGTKTFKNPDCKINLDVARPLTTDQNKRAGTTNYLCDELPPNYDLSMSINKPKVLGGIGEKKSNGGTQWYQQDRIYDNNVGLSLSTTAQPYYPDKQLRIRKLTPCECWKLMGFDKSDFDKASKVNSNAQLYKQAGNSICVPVLEAILRKLLKGADN
jgi:DNA (cytosine-5)-methyltransferase 1